jgi:hypothetical protein
MSEANYEITVRAAPYSDGSGYAAKAVIAPDDAGEATVQIDVIYRITAEQWSELKQAIDDALGLSDKFVNARAA